MRRDLSTTDLFPGAVARRSLAYAGQAATGDAALQVAVASGRLPVAGQDRA
jgi:hypothetical protein